MDVHGRLSHRVAAEQDDVLCTLPLVGHEPALADHLFAQLVDLLVESMFLDVRRAYLEGELDREAYVGEVAWLADRCRRVGLLPLPAPGR